METFCVAKPQKRDLQTVQPRSGVLLRFVIANAASQLRKYDTRSRNTLNCFNAGLDGAAAKHDYFSVTAYIANTALNLARQ